MHLVLPIHLTDLTWHGPMLLLHASDSKAMPLPYGSFLLRCPFFALQLAEIQLYLALRPPCLLSLTMPQSPSLYFLHFCQDIAVAPQGSFFP